MHFTKTLITSMAVAVPLAAAAPAVGEPAGAMERRFVGDNGNVPSLYARDNLEARGRIVNGLLEVSGGLKDSASRAKSKVLTKVAQKAAAKAAAAKAHGGGQVAPADQYSQTDLPSQTDQSVELQARDTDEAADEEADESAELETRDTDEAADEEADESAELETRDTHEAADGSGAPTAPMPKTGGLKGKALRAGNRVMAKAKPVVMAKVGPVVAKYKPVVQAKFGPAVAKLHTKINGGGQAAPADLSSQTEASSEVAARDIDEAADESAELETRDIDEAAEEYAQEMARVD